MRHIVTSVGTISPAQTVSIKSSVSGVVASSLVRRGELVKFGDLIMELDPSKTESEVAAARSVLAEAEQTIIGLEATANVARVELLRSQLARVKELVDEGLAPRAQADEAQYELDEALMYVKSRIAAVAAQKERVRQLEARLESALTDLAMTQIRSPLDGIVLELPVTVGSAVSGVSDSASGGTEVAVVGSAEEAVFVGSVSAGDLNKLSPGLTATVILEGDDVEYSGRLQFVARQASTVDGGRPTFEIRVALLSRPPGGWRYGTPADSYVTVHEQLYDTTLPAGCIKYDPVTAQPYVAVLGNRDTLARQDVDVAAFDEGRVAVTGLPSEARVGGCALR